MFAVKCRYYRECLKMKLLRGFTDGLKFENRMVLKRFQK
ncbi:hypothetical protein FSU_0454 [Fibrobacter succinogenes subsp. succinogenes S85]|uniref:Uncharacterized protein n=1 Tax=Fibrobacter succinogenes (strain ATCC 19169 / S85) TaxID=59374 RepID=D9S6G8_FIBSS|nr:hypothetical protein FSU_0454 [Fibrobacter succinogenes subsp. succinogenes S85]